MEELPQENSDVPYIMPMFNSEEKIQEVNRLLEILAKRKKYSIVVTMLLVFQKFNYQKIMREYLLSGVKQIIIENPLRVVSYHGVPFTTKNFIRGMRVEYGKHKLFNKEMIDGIEYYYTNIVYTCIYLSDEIAKICKGSKNLKTVHYSLIDDLELEGKAFPMSTDTGNNNDIYLNEKRKRSQYSENPEDEGKNKMLDKAPVHEGVTLRKKKYGERDQNNIINLHDSDESDDDNKKKPDVKSFSTTENTINETGNNINMGVNNSINKMNSNDNINKIKGDNLDTASQHHVITEKLNYKQIKRNTLIHYQDDLHSLKYTIHDVLNLFDYSKDSPLYQYLKDNIENITLLKDVFILFQNIGTKGQSLMENLYKIIPEDFTKDENVNENEVKVANLDTDKETQKKLEHIDELFKKYEDKKKNLLYLYQLIQSTVKNIRHSGNEFDKSLIKNDLEYIDMNEKKFEEIADEMYPLLTEIYNYFVDNFKIKETTNSLQNILNSLSKNEMNYRTFLNFTQNLAVLLPYSQNKKNGKNIFDYFMREDLSVEEREKQFKNTVLQEKNLLLKYISPLRKYFKEENEKNENKEEKDNK